MYFKGLTFKQLPINPETLAQLHPNCPHNLHQLLSVCPPVHLFKLLSTHLPIHHLESRLPSTSPTSKVLPLTVQLTGLLTHLTSAQLDSAGGPPASLLPSSCSCIPITILLACSQASLELLKCCCGLFIPLQAICNLHIHVHRYIHCVMCNVCSKS